MTINTTLTLFVIFSILLLISRLTKGSVVEDKGIKPKETAQEAYPVANLSIESMTEYTRTMSYDLGFNKQGVKFKRQAVLKRKGLTADEEIYLEKCKMLDPKFSDAMKNLIALRLLHTEQVLKNKTIRVFIDTMNDTKVIARDDSAILELDLNTVYGRIAGEFVLINLDKEGEDLKINYVLADSSKDSSEKNNLN